VALYPNRAELFKEYPELGYSTGFDVCRSKSG